MDVPFDVTNYKTKYDGTFPDLSNVCKNKWSVTITDASKKGETKMRYGVLIKYLTDEDLLDYGIRGIGIRKAGTVFIIKEEKRCFGNAVDYWAGYVVDATDTPVPRAFVAHIEEWQYNKLKESEPSNMPDSGEKALRDIINKHDRKTISKLKERIEELKKENRKLDHQNDELSEELEKQLNKNYGDSKVETIEIKHKFKKNIVCEKHGHKMSRIAGTLSYYCPVCDPKFNQYFEARRINHRLTFVETLLMPDHVKQEDGKAYYYNKESDMFFSVELKEEEGE